MQYEGRLRFLSVVVLLFGLVLVSKLYLVQIVSGVSYREKAAGQQVVGANYFDRGSIYFSTKDGTLVPAATVQSGFTLAINTDELEKNNLEQIYTKLNEIVPIDRANFFARATRVGRYEELYKRLNDEEAERIQALAIPGVVTARTRWRTYPGKEMAAHAVGLIGYAGDELAGRYGLERKYEETLKRSGDSTFVNFFAEIFSNIKETLVRSEGQEGDIVTTIEPSVEAFLETELERTNTRYTSDFTGGIIINPNTGEIYGMALSPTFDPNAPQNEESSAIFSNKLVEDRHEMGSIVKALTLAIGLDTGRVTAKTTYNDPGCMTLNTRTFCNYDKISHGSNLTMQEVLNQSLNTGAAYVAARVGNKDFASYMKNFGLGELSLIDLPSEGISLVSNLDTGRDLELAQASFGQGIALTPITTVRALSALANGGTLITPHLTREIKYKIGTFKTTDITPEEERPRVIKPETSEAISRMLTEAVDRSLRFGSMSIPTHSVAAKTGTAQIAREDRAGYYDDRYLHSFFGYFPAYDPQFLVFLYTYHPKGVHFASETLTDSFFNIVKFLITYYNVPPDRGVPQPTA